MCPFSAKKSSNAHFFPFIQTRGYSTKNNAPMVMVVHHPMVFSESRACSTAPVLTSEAMSSILSVASKPGSGSGSSTNQTLRKMMKYMIPRKPANILATMPTKARLNVSALLMRGPSAKKYFGSEASKKIAGKVKMKPVEAWVAPVVADVAMLTSDGDHLSAMPRR